MTYELSDILFYILLYSLLGWLIETCCIAIKDRHYYNRGFLNLPLALPYGITAALLGYDYLFSYMVNESLGKLLRIVFVVAAAVWLMLACYTFPLQAQFQNRVKTTLQNALFLALSHLGQTVMVMLIHLVPVAVCLALPELFARLLPVWIFAAPGLIAFLCTLRLRKLWASLRQQAEAETAPKEAQ